MPCSGPRVESITIAEHKTWIIFGIQVGSYMIGMWYNWYNLSYPSPCLAELLNQYIAVSGSLNRWYVIYNHPIGSIDHLYTTYILPSGGLYATYLPLKGTRKLHWLKCCFIFSNQPQETTSTLNEAFRCCWVVGSWMMNSPVLPVSGIFYSEKVFESWVLEFMIEYILSICISTKTRNSEVTMYSYNGRIEVCPKWNWIAIEFEGCFYLLSTPGVWQWKKNSQKIEPVTTGRFFRRSFHFQQLDFFRPP